MVRNSEVEGDAPVPGGGGVGTFRPPAPPRPWRTSEKGEEEGEGGVGGEMEFKNLYLRYSAIFLGVSFTALGAVLLFWGLLWQAHAILLAERGASAPQGGECLIPSGVIILTLGVLWLKVSLKPPRKKRAKEKVRCPSCGRLVDSDLPFCYWCGAPLKDLGEEKNIRRGGY